MAERYGQGIVHITTRQGCEIHNIPANELEEAVNELKQAGILMGMGGPRGRTVMACPGMDTCRDGIIHTKELAEKIDERYFGKDVRKFKIAVAILAFRLGMEKSVSCCPENAWLAKVKGYSLFLGGNIGKKPRLGKRVKILIQSEEEFFRYLDRAMEYFKTNRRGKKEGFSHILEGTGATNIEKEVLF